MAERKCQRANCEKTVTGRADRKFCGASCRQMASHEKNFRRVRKAAIKPRLPRLGSKERPLIVVKCLGCGIIYMAKKLPTLHSDMLCARCKPKFEDSGILRSAQNDKSGSRRVSRRIAAHRVARQHNTTVLKAS